MSKNTTKSSGKSPKFLYNLSSMNSNAQPNAQPKKSADPKLLILAFIMLVNALAYGTIIPLLYPYAERFGINAVGLSLLFASFSLAQFISTPILGRLSDKFGRKPVLLICLFGTSLSLGLFAAATNIAMLFAARLIDGITGGNISVAQAMIADSTKGEERAKAFGLLGGAFGVGFVAGPGLGGLMSNFGLSAPFWFSAGLALVGTVAGILVLKETLPAEKRQPSDQPLFHVKSFVKALFLPLTGIVLLINLISAIAQNSFVIGFQSYTNDILQLSPTQVGLIFVMFGVMNIITQVIGLRLLLAKVHSKNLIVTASLLLSSVFMLLAAFSHNVYLFTTMVLGYGIMISPQVPVLTGLLSERTKGEDQGIILGINQSYSSLGQIIGPLLAGAVAGFSIPYIFVLSATILFGGFISCKWLYTDTHHKLNF